MKAKTFWTLSALFVLLVCNVSSGQASSASLGICSYYYPIQETFISTLDPAWSKAIVGYWRPPPGQHEIVFRIRNDASRLTIVKITPYYKEYGVTDWKPWGPYQLSYGKELRIPLKTGKNITYQFVITKVYTPSSRTWIQYQRIQSYQC